MIPAIAFFLDFVEYGLYKVLKNSIKNKIVVGIVHEMNYQHKNLMKCDLKSKTI